MSDNANDPLSFWQELKRRKVVRVIMVYAAAAFVILELVSIIEEPLQLPDWTLELVIVLLCIGFIITVILSWVYDITPEGIEKTKPAKEVKEELIEKPSQLKAWKIATILSVVVIIGLIILNILGRREKVEDIAILDKSIAVLPFVSLSADPEKQYLADGIMDAILLHLSKIEDLRVMSRTSVEQYRETEKTATEICQELDVAFVLEGSFRKYGDQARLIVQLIQSGKEDHAWANKYDREWKDIFTVESEVAQSIAMELHAVITPEEKQLIEKTPTTSLTAYDFYQRGKEEYIKYKLDKYNREALESAEYFYYEALKYDSTFALAYTGLAWVYSIKNEWVTVLTEDFLDSMLILADIALSFDDQLAEAYVIRGAYYYRNNKKDPALEEYNKAIEFNPNEWQAYLGKTSVYWKEDDYVSAIDNCYKAASLHRGPLLPVLYSNISSVYGFAGFNEKKIYYSKEALKLDNDSARYYESLGSIEETNGNFNKAIEFYKEAYTIDSTDLNVIFRLGMVHSYLGLNEEYLKYIKENYLRRETLDDPNIIFRLGHAYRVNGFKEEAEYYFNEGLRFHKEMLELDIHYFAGYWTLYSLAAAHALLGDKKKAFDNLKLMNQHERMPKWMIKDIKNDPLFDSIRDDPEFQQVVNDIEAKYQAEHERVKKWLEENNML